MRQSKADVYLHFIWTTKWREPVVAADAERDMYRIIEAEVKRLRCVVLAIGGMPDHVHLLIRYGRSVTLGRLMNQVKGVSSAFMNDRKQQADGMFRWQPGYGVFSVGLNQVDRVIAYIQNQKRHHAKGSIWSAWEEPDEDEEVDDDPGDTDGAS